MRLGETLVKAIAMLCRCLTRGRDIINIKMKWAVVVLALATVVGLGVLMIQRGIRRS